MPFVRGFLKVGRRQRPGRPDIGLPDEPEVDPGYGIEEGEPPEIDGGLPEPPPGIWPPLTPEHPWRPIPGFPDRPSTGPVPPQPAPGQPLPRPPSVPGQLPEIPPGTIWPPLPPGVHGKYWALVAVGGMPGGTVYRYVVVDADARPPRPVDPDYGVEGPPPAQPKR